MNYRLASLSLAFLAAGIIKSAAVTAEWDFNNNTSATAATPAADTLAILPGTPATSYTTSGGDTYLNLPKMTSNTNQGLAVSIPNVPGTGASNYVNQYSFIFDINIPSETNWTPLLQTQPNNASGNDADIYVDNTGKLGISAIGYSAANAVTANAWHRIVLSFDLANSKENYYVDGVNVLSATVAGSTLEGRFDLYSHQANQTAPTTAYDVLLFNEGFNTTGATYTNAVKLSAVGFTDTALTSSQAAALGGVNVSGIFAVPEPSAGYLALLVAFVFGAVRFTHARCRKA